MTCAAGEEGEDDRLIITSIKLWGGVSSEKFKFLFCPSVNDEF